ncbi:hypothetical protein [Shewanella sp. KX20019]|uniref:hypothetical protein n=1 Tax=Shewanella sp. KX20019 TaxID=2803864 RepID=UPI001F2690D6|nr:hypothetical protein [Shewanella sp. KX20019]
MQNTHKSVVLRVLYTLFMAVIVSGCEPDNGKNVTSFKQETGLCNFQKGACSNTVDGTELNLRITPWNTPSEKPLELSLSSSVPLEKVKIRVEGRDMFMGIIPVNLAQETETSYNAPLIYGSCSSGYMVWQAIVSYEQDGIEKFTIFEFLADSEKAH